MKCFPCCKSLAHGVDRRNKKVNQWQEFSSTSGINYLKDLDGNLKTRNVKMRICGDCHGGARSLKVSSEIQFSSGLSIPRTLLLAWQFLIGGTAHSAPGARVSPACLCKCNQPRGEIIGARRCGGLLRVCVSARKYGGGKSTGNSPCSFRCALRCSKVAPGAATSRYLLCKCSIGLRLWSEGLAKGVGLQAPF